MIYLIMTGINDVFKYLEIDGRHCNTPIVAWVAPVTFLEDRGQDTQDTDPFAII